MGDVAGFFTKYKDALVTVGWSVVALGWLITNWQANKREKRKESRAEVEAICKAASEVILKSRKYYSCLPSDDEDDVRAAEIAFEVKRILIRTERLNRRAPHFTSAVFACGEFFDCVTEQPFASKNREKHGPGSQTLQKIEMSVHNLIDKLEEGFSAAFS